MSAIAHVSRDEVNTANSSGNTALHFAAEYNKPLVIEALLKHGASLEKRNKLGFSALQIASLKCYKQCIEVPYILMGQMQYFFLNVSLPRSY